MSQTQSSTTRVPGLDALKFLAIIAVVWIHTPESNALIPSVAYCRFAVPAFTSASVLLVIWKLNNQRVGSWFRYVADRALRLYTLFLVWNMIYLVTRLLKHALAGGGDPIAAGAWTLLLVGVAHHLWYLPVLAIFLLGSGVLAWAYDHLNASAQRVLVGLCLLTGFAIGLFPNPIAIDMVTRPWTYSLVLGWQNIPALLFAFPVYAVWRSIQASRMRGALAMLAFVLGICCLQLSAHGIAAVLCLNLAGTAFVFWSLFWRAPETMAKLGRLSFAVYAVHMLFVDSIQSAGHALHIRLPALDAITFVLAVLASFATAHLITNSNRFSLLVQTRISSRSSSHTLSRTLSKNR